MNSTPKKINKYSKFEKKDFLFVYLFVLFPVVQFAMFWLYVNASSIGLAFRDGVGNFTLTNFKTVFDSFFKSGTLFGFRSSKSLMRSMILWIVGEGLCFPISLITTYVLTRKIKGHYFFRICYIIPSLMGAIIWVLIVRQMVGNGGPVMFLFDKLGIDLPELAQHSGLLADDKTAFPTLVITRAIMAFVGNNAVLTGAYTRVPDELFESADLDGAGFNTELFKIAIPCIWPTISTLLTFSLCSIFTCDYNVYLFTNGTGNHETSTIGFQLFHMTYSLSQGSSMGYGTPAAFGVVLTVFTVPVVLVGKYILEKITDTVEV